ncbi:MAG: hypothetical protein VX878_16085 [Pseudomonadota bacterium]|nr:hypothetical protein [Pseudomonadota bacterium]MEC9105332.1 hypothetical protein [Pseudomonadota bacterium]MEC9312564.1 hypothetical protein [Pseudomonadota bacterium]
MLFRPIRLLILLTVAFGAGMLYERERQAEECLDEAGILQDIMCG